uniref:hypothetical protein n=1 Tax=uncultured Eudoraea sp. TaxID=1035614 RepID=UPI002602EC62
EAILSLEDTALTGYYSPAVLKFLQGMTDAGKPLSASISHRILRLPQKKYESKQCRIRKALMKQDQRQRRTLAFSGRFE